MSIWLAVLLLSMMPLVWLIYRLTAQRCPGCGSTWRTHLVGSWGGEDWHCRKCGQFWTV